MSIPSIEMNTGDLSPSIVATLQNSDGSIFNLTGCTVLFQMSQQGQILFSHAALVTNASGGVVQYNWQESDTEMFTAFALDNLLLRCQAVPSSLFQQSVSSTLFFLFNQ